MYLILGVYPLITVLINPEPQLSTLRPQKIKIIRAHALSPQIVGVLETGAQVKMDFAHGLYLAPVHPVRFSGLGLEQISNLEGCNAIVVFDEVHSIFTPELRLWSLSCGAINWSLSDGDQYFRRDSKVGVWLAVGFAVTVLTIIFLTVKVNRRTK